MFEGETNNLESRINIKMMFRLMFILSKVDNWFSGA